MYPMVNAILAGASNDASGDVGGDGSKSRTLAAAAKASISSGAVISLVYHVAIGLLQ
ncbi:hypothetical protein FHS26_000911 [Rhizobium pisi]|uniref:Uncharacterized protein n=2 Tax=Rhizobium TaxID=379 RepID=A0A7W6FH33_9HYPH|nr:hypothetical protein [Rhizobium pisi]MBB3913339.1 hypothetical protein [Rhizobium fabae]